jgi:hypothetical protein
MESERLNDGIAIHYSMPSVHAATILGYHERGGGDDDDEDGEAQPGPRVRFPGNRDGWVRVVKDLGMQFDFVAAEQVEGGGLASGGYRALVLPLSLAISPEEVKAIEAFVSAGGVVIADAAAGLTDEHCAWRQRGALDDLFGIAAPPPEGRALATAGGAVSVTDEGARWGLSGKDVQGLAVAESGVKAAGATPLVRVGGADAVTAKRVGKGWAIYLNTLFDGYSRQRREKFGGGAHRALVGALLAHAGMRPTIDVLAADGARLAQAQVARYRFGDAEVLAVVKDNVALEGVAGMDGVTVYNDEGLGRVARQEITVRLPRRAYVTDVRSGKRYGLTDVVSTSVVVGDAVVLALSPAENALDLAGPASATLGEHPAFTVTSSLPGRRLVRFHVSAPDGTPVPAYSANVLLEGGPARVVLPSALNDPAGTYTLRVTDVVTGAAAEAAITLK